MAVPQNVQALYRAMTGNIYRKRESEFGALFLMLPRTNNPNELAALYTMSDVFVNPTYEDNYPTVNLEAQACGTWVVTYDTGGCRETLK